MISSNQQQHMLLTEFRWLWSPSHGERWAWGNLAYLNSWSTIEEQYCIAMNRVWGKKSHAPQCEYSGWSSRLELFKHEYRYTLILTRLASWSYVCWKSWTLLPALTRYDFVVNRRSWLYSLTIAAFSAVVSARYSSAYCSRISMRLTLSSELSIIQWVIKTRWNMINDTYPRLLLPSFYLPKRCTNLSSCNAAPSLHGRTSCPECNAADVHTVHRGH